MVADGIHCIACVDMREASSPFSSRRKQFHELRSQLQKMGICVELGHEAIKLSSDLAVATSWRTAYDVAACNSPRKAYFIQDYEPWFYARGDNYLRAEQSYRLGLTPVVLGNWLAKKVGALSSKAPYYIPFSVDDTIYFRNKNVPRSKSICYLHQPEKPRRCSALAHTALAIVKTRRPDIEIWSYGSKYKPSLQVIDFGIQSREGCASLYNRASVGFCISASNPSRVPFEMAACNLRVVDIDAENTRQDALSGYSILAAPDHLSLANALIRAVDETGRGQNQHQTTHHHNAYDELAESSKAFNEILRAASYRRQVTENIPSIATVRWRHRVREKLVKAYIAFSEE